MIQKLITFYLDFKNSQISIKDYAAWHGFSVSDCTVLLNAGKKLIENIDTPTGKKLD